MQVVGVGKDARLQPFPSWAMNEVGNPAALQVIAPDVTERVLGGNLRANTTIPRACLALKSTIGTGCGS